MLIPNSLSDRGTELSSVGGIIDTFKAILGNPYDPDTNPDGFVNIGTAENYIMLEENAKFINKHIELDWKDFSYGEGPWGSPRLREAMANHMNRHLKPHLPVKADRLLFANGVTSICEMLGFTICDPGDLVLLSRPIYQAFKADFGTKARVGCEYVSFGDADQFHIEGVSKYEEAIVKAEKAGSRIRALILCHPHNPLGRCYTPDTLIALMKLCNKYQIHLIVDEIYALSVYDIPDPKAVKFSSILTFDTDQHISPDYIHHLYGMSKDTAAGGIRLGCLYTRNKELMRASQAIAQFHWSGNANEKVATLMLEDEKWMDDFLALSRARLAERNKLVRQILHDNGIGFYPGANAGFFLWIDLRPWIHRSSGDDDVWAGEDDLTKRLIANKVYVTNGKEMSAEEPGWYRLIFSQDERVVREGIKRIVQVIKGKGGENGVHG